MTNLQLISIDMWSYWERSLRLPYVNHDESLE
mgnify:CR=1 FL=1